MRGNPFYIQPTTTYHDLLSPHPTPSTHFSPHPPISQTSLHTLPSLTRPSHTLLHRYRIGNTRDGPLLSGSVRHFVESIASRNATPGGGAAAAYSASVVGRIEICLFAPFQLSLLLLTFLSFTHLPHLPPLPGSSTRDNGRLAHIWQPEV